MVHAGQAWAQSQFGNGTPDRTRQRSTDCIVIKNTCGADRKAGDILKVDGNAINVITAEHIWLKGIEPTIYGTFGILREPLANGGVGVAQVSGVCMARVNITDAAHTHAYMAHANYVLQSSTGGPIRILHKESGTGIKDCPVMFAAPERKTIVLAAAASPATNASTTPTSVSAYVLERNASGNLVYANKQITVVVIDEQIETIPQYALGKADWENGRWELDNADCDALSAATRTSMGLPG